MSELESTRLIIAVMYKLAFMVVWYQRGNTDRGKELEGEVRKVLVALGEVVE